MSNTLGMPISTSKVFKVVAKAAGSHQTITYKQVGDQVGIHWRQVPGRLYAIWQWCSSQNPPLPHLNAIVVNSTTGRPGSGYTPNGLTLSEVQFQAIKSKVFDFDWQSVKFPT